MQRGFSNIFLIIAIIILLLVGGVVYIVKTSNLKINQATPDISSTPSPTNGFKWQTYVNKKQSYQVNYTSTAEYKENNTTDYDYTDFLNGCFKVYAGPDGFNKKISNDQSGIPWQNLDDLSKLKEGESITYPNEERKTREDGSFIIKFTYKKIAIKMISGFNWTALESSNNWENHSSNNIYYINRNSKLYLINMLSYGSCYEDEPIKMLETFKLNE